MTDGMSQWIYDLAEALGYKHGHELPPSERRMVDLPLRPFAFIKGTNDRPHPQVVIFEADGEEGPYGMRIGRALLPLGREIAMRTIRVELPHEFDLVAVHDDSNIEHLIALRTDRVIDHSFEKAS